MFNHDEHFNGAVILHLTDLWAFNIIIDKLNELMDIFNLIISVETENGKNIRLELEKLGIEAQVFIVEKSTFAYPFINLEISLVVMTILDFLNSFMIDSDDFYSGRSIYTELSEMMFYKNRKHTFEFLNNNNIGVVFPDIPTSFRLQRLVDADMENKLSKELNRLESEVSERKLIFPLSILLLCLMVELFG